MCAPDAPAPPDPKETASAQTGTSIGTAIANNRMGAVNQYGPNSQTIYEQTGSTSYTDPYTGQTYELPSYAARTSLTGDAAAANTAGMDAKRQLAELAQANVGNLGDILGTKSPDFTADRQRVEDALMERMQPQLARDRENLDTQLINRGIGLGSEAYSAAQSDFGRNVNDARLGAVLNAGQEQSRLVNTDIAKRNQSINEILGLMGGGQVAAPNAPTYQPQGAATTDVAGLIGQNYNAQMQNYQQDMASRNGLFGSLLGAGATILGAPSGSLLGGLFRG